MKPDDRTAIRPAITTDVEGIARVHVTAWSETYAGIMPEHVIASRPLARRVEQWSGVLRDPGSYYATATYVAVDGDMVVGFAAGGTQRDTDLEAKGYAGEFSAIYVLQSHQGGGVGVRLMREMAGNLLSRGFNAASLWVLRDNIGARRFYERLGGEIIGEKEETREGVVLVDIGYGWRDLTPLLAS